ncbi:unnamed protein product [Effrenium voratum]|nr:unnamed protein product [Effrenium voratum]
MSKLVFLLPLVALAELHGDELQQKFGWGDINHGIHAIADEVQSDTGHIVGVGKNVVDGVGQELKMSFATATRGVCPAPVCACFFGQEMGYAKDKAMQVADGTTHLGGKITHKIKHVVNLEDTHPSLRKPQVDQGEWASIRPSSFVALVLLAALALAAVLARARRGSGSYEVAGPSAGE